MGVWLLILIPLWILRNFCIVGFLRSLEIRLLCIGEGHCAEAWAVRWRLANDFYQPPVSLSSPSEHPTSDKLRGGISHLYRVPTSSRHTI